MLFSRSRSFEEWQDEMDAESELDCKIDDTTDIKLENAKYENMVKSSAIPKYERVKQEIAKYDLKADKNRKNRAILKLISQKIDGTQE